MFQVNVSVFTEVESTIKLHSQMLNP